ncbi:MAG: hypothetical protein JEZ04_10585 [Spirochaetales bacterium]|nr:hypothetical protein [Spirochaetales bacterium]
MDLGHRTVAICADEEKIFVWIAGAILWALLCLLAEVLKAGYKEKPGSTLKQGSTLKKIRVIATVPGPICIRGQEFLRVLPRMDIGYRTVAICADLREEFGWESRGYTLSFARPLSWSF